MRAFCFRPRRVLLDAEQDEEALEIARDLENMLQSQTG